MKREVEIKRKKRKKRRLWQQRHLQKDQVHRGLSRFQFEKSFSKEWKEKIKEFEIILPNKQVMFVTNRFRETILNDIKMRTYIENSMKCIKMYYKKPRIYRAATWGDLAKEFDG